MISKQEMFDRAYRGLSSQGWRRAVGPRGCSYLTSDGRRCAWGWVDQSLGQFLTGAVDNIGCGIAKDLDQDHIIFACELQSAHDATDDCYLRQNITDFAHRHNLTIPELP